MKLLKNIYIILICCLSCNAPNPFEGKHKIVGDFPKHLYLEAEELAIDAMGIVDIKIVDTILIALLKHPDILLSAYSLSELQPLGNLLKKGQGPNEFLSVSTPIQFISDSCGVKVWVEDTQTYCFFLLNITRTIEMNQPIIEKRYDLKKFYFTKNWIYVEDSLFFGVNMAMDNLELIGYNIIKDKVVLRDRLFKTTPNAAGCDHIWWAGTTTKPDLSKIALTLTFLNQIQIISLKDSTDRFSFSTSKKPVSFEHIITNAPSDLVAYFRDIRVTDQLIFASYSDLPLKDQLDPTKATKTMIHVFDWNGNPKALLEIPNYTPYFDIDAKGGYLYCLSEEEKIYRYNISEILDE